MDYDLDFERIKKEVKLTDVLLRYQVPLRFKGDYAVCVCPLPTHKKGDTSKSFSINLAGNYWRCFSESCNANNGGRRGGDVINFVAVMDGCKEKDAAIKLAVLYGKEETAPRRAKPSKEKQKTQMQRTISKSDASSGGVNYMSLIDAWLDELLDLRGDEDEEEFWKRLRKEFKSKLVDSYNAGKKAGK